MRRHYLIKGADSLTLVDCGFVRSMDALEQALSRQGAASQDITHLVLIHHDHDHMGNAAALKAQFPTIQVTASIAEAPYISGQAKSLRLAQAEQMQATLPPEQKAFGEAFCNILKGVQPVPIDLPLENGQPAPWHSGCITIATPGHTPGHISLYLPAEKVVVTGDAFALEEKRPAIANPQFTLDMPSAQASMEKLLALDAASYICYHGGMYPQ